MFGNCVRIIAYGIVQPKYRSSRRRIEVVGAVELPRITFAGRVLTDGEIRRLLAELPWDIRRAARFCLFTGMRRGEIESLEWSQVRRDGRTTYIVIPVEKSKSRRERVVPLCSTALRVLGPKGSGFVFPLSACRIQKAMVRACRRAKLGRIRFHDLRHTAAERVIRMHGPSKPVLEVFGGSSGSSAMPYIHPRPGAGLMDISYRA